MRTLVIVKPKISSQILYRLLDLLVVVEINLFVLHRAPQPLHENIVHCSSPSIHADRDAALLHSSFASRRNVQTDGKNGTVIEVQARVTNDEAQDRETASFAYELLERLASLAGNNTAPSETNFARETASPSRAKPMLVKSRSTSTGEGSPAHAVIVKVDRMKTCQGESLFLKVDVGGETARVRPSRRPGGAFGSEWL
jgi:hypothetical protein